MYPSMSVFLAMNDDERASCVRHIRVANGFRPLISSGPCKLPRMEHSTTGIVCRMVFGDSFAYGLSESEYSAAMDISRDVEPFLKRQPIRQRHYAQSMLVAERPISEDCYHTVTGKKYVNRAGPFGYPVRITFDEAADLCRQLNARIVTDFEWEYLCRGGGSSLFFFGDSLPDTSTLAEYVRHDFGGKFQPRANSFGLEGLFAGEWTTGTEIVDGREFRIVRGGGSELWPWQGDDWIWCMSAARNMITTSAVTIPGSPPFSLVCRHAVRPVWDLEQNPG